ncbi:hypothetical protein BHE74_00050892 [Ensete ventricosum]|uniref:Exportin-1/Importin-beta-like domain-containing protein n=1 Tax=Ensete ventricosum TaxID=4639 RepID=A0A427AWV8_ENSVE|nr:hypothetical protein B296_00005329 [Ensete ventricosum]RWW43449.1 hypothetical protein BHE74_00050892 [Ensete ventricosum]
MAERLRDLSQPIDVPLLDATVAAFYGTGSKEEVGFPLAPGVLFGSVSFVLGFLVAVRCSQVGGFCPPGVARSLDGIGGTLRATSFFRFNITNQILQQLQTNPDTWLQVVHILQNSQSLNTKFFALQHEWPARWQSFIPDLVSAAKSSETICENCMAILKIWTNSPQGIAFGVGA